MVGKQMSALFAQDILQPVINRLFKQWGLATTNNNWNEEIILSIPFTSEFYAITTIPFAIGGVITGGIYRDYGGINSILRNGFYGGYGKAGIRFFYIAIGC